MSRTATSTIQLTEIEVKPGGDWHDWAKIQLEESTGAVTIRSDYGNWSFGGWYHRGEGLSLAKFLTQINADYAGGKFLGANLDVFDADGSRKHIREYIIEARREAGIHADDEQARQEEIYHHRNREWLHSNGKYPGSKPEDVWTKDRAKSEWDLVADLSCMQDWLHETTIEDAWQIGRVMMMEPDWRHFWDRIWVPHVKPALLEIVESEAA